MRLSAYLGGMTHVWGKYVFPTLCFLPARSPNEVNAPIGGSDGQTMRVTGRFVGFFYIDSSEHVQSGLWYSVRLKKKKKNYIHIKNETWYIVFTKLIIIYKSQIEAFACPEAVHSRQTWDTFEDELLLMDYIWNKVTALT